MVKISYKQFISVIEWSLDLRCICHHTSYESPITLRLYEFDPKEFDETSNDEPLYFVVHWDSRGTHDVYIYESKKWAQRMFEKIRKSWEAK